MFSRLNEYVVFFKEFRNRFETTGAVLPSSRWLAGRLTWALNGRDKTEPVRVLEVGPGTGAVTKRIVKLLREGDRLDLVELNGFFVSTLQRRFDSEPDFQRVASQVRIHCCPIQQFQCDEPYDFIISGLPFNNFSASLVDQILQSCLNMLSESGTLSYFEYMGVRPLRMRVGKRAERQRLKELDEVLRRYLTQFRIRRDLVLLNIPPALVHHLQKKPRT